MSYRKSRPKKELEIVSLIDVVFLLIIFGLVISVSGFIGKDKGKSLTKTFTLVISRVETQNSQGEPESRLSVTFRDAEKHEVSGTSYFPIDDSLSTSVIDRYEWERLPACSTIREHIATLTRSVGGGADSQCAHATLDVEVTHDTRTRIVNYILEQCAPLNCSIGWVRVVSK